MQRASRFGHNFANMTVDGSETPAPAPIQARLALTEPRSETLAGVNTGVPLDVKAGIEHLSGVSIDDVQVQYNSPKPTRLNALAYTQGTMIHVAPGQEKHLPHELWHAVQQKQGRVRPVEQVNGQAINTDSYLEAEAAAMGARALKLGPMVQSGTPAPKNGTLPIIAAPPLNRNLAPSSLAVVQPLMTRDQFRSASRTGPSRLSRIDTRPRQVKALDRMISDYHGLHEANNEQNAHARLQALHGIQTHIHQQIAQQGFNPGASHHEGMLQLLDDARQEHQGLIHSTARNNWRLWVPGRERMQEGERQQLDATWRHVVSGEGGQLKISNETLNAETGDPEQVEGFGQEMHAHIARLMATNTGRRLISGLDQGRHRVTVSPVYTGQTPEDQAASVKAYGVETSGYDRERNEGGVLTPGEGSHSVVRMESGTTDTGMVDFGAHNQPILSPAYIGLGHELIHALHNQRGAAWAPGTHQPERFGEGGTHRHYHNPEEFHTIAYQHGGNEVPLEHITENMIRQESQIPAREGHTSLPRRDVIYSRLRGWLQRTGARINPILRPRRL